MLPLSLLVSGLLVGLSHQQATSQQPVVDLGYVKYAGITNTTTNITSYRSIRYAQPPLGDLRWRAPLPIEQNATYGQVQTVQATQFPQLCYQSGPVVLLLKPETSGSLMQDAAQGEDCLFLNVLTPETPKNTSLPVIVQIHGGGYTMGGPYQYPGDSVVYASDGQVIYVEMQYRLGVFGFLAGSAVSNDGAFNVGLLDQRLALEWVQRHIAAFGGDPSRVTIWGGSAGGGSVTYQLTAYGATDNPPFSAAIAEYPWWTPLLNTTTQDEQYHNTLRAANCSDLSCLRALPPATLATVNQVVQNTTYPAPGLAYGVFYYGPVLDGSFIRALPSTSFQTGAFHKLPLLVDRDAAEGTIFTNASLVSQAAGTTDARLLFQRAGPSFFARLYDLYPASAYVSPAAQRAAWFGDALINCASSALARAMRDAAPQPHKVFKMHFRAGGGLHAATVPFLTSRDVELSGASNATLARWMVRWWVSFAVHGDPNVGRAEGAPRWPSYAGDGAGGEGEERVLRVDEADVAEERDPDAGAQCDFWGAQGNAVLN